MSEDQIGYSESQSTEEIGETPVISTEFRDSSGNVLCEVDIDHHTGLISVIHPKHYINAGGVAENVDERICVTDEQGNITDERLTRVEAREAKRRYLIVTTLIFHDNKILVQKRSEEKKIDPGLESSSAHGVAKELFTADGHRIVDGKVAALINAALETNEELRHDDQPFTIRVWHGSHDELVAFAEQEHISDPNEVWLVEEEYLPDDRYPLGSASNDTRTRALYAGFIFSDETPHISVDQAEVQAASWRTTEELFQNPQASKDLPASSRLIIKGILSDHPLTKRYGPVLADNIIRRAEGHPKERTD